MRWAIIGAGAIAFNRFAPALRRSGQPLTGISRRDPGQLQQWQRFADADAVVTTDPSRMLEQARPDAVYVASPPAFHVDHAALALEHGCPVLVEKPLALDAAQARRLRDVAQANGTFFTTALMMRHNTQHQRLREAIAERQLGDIRSMTLRMAFDYTAPRTWRMDPTLGGGGAFADLGPHLLDLTQFLTGDQIDGVGGVMAAVTTQTVEDSAAICARLRGGTLAAIFTHFNLPTQCAPSRIEVNGTHGYAIIEGSLGQTDEGTSTICNTRGTTRHLTTDPGDLYLRQLDAFADLAGASTQWERRMDEDVALQAVIDSVYADCDGLRQ